MSNDTKESIEAFQKWVNRLSHDKSKAQAVIAYNMECEEFADNSIIQALVSCDIHNPVCKTDTEGWIARVQYLSLQLPFYYRMDTLMCFNHVCQIIEHIQALLKAECDTDIQPIINHYSTVSQLVENTTTEIRRVKNRIKKLKGKLSKLEVQLREDIAEQEELRSTLLGLYNGPVDRFLRTKDRKIEDTSSSSSPQTSSKNSADD